jgi:hypothetical protein
MWSLPDIKRLNDEATTKRKALQRAARTGRLNGKKLTCEWAGHDGECTGELYHYLWYDIFSDDPKGIVSLCDTHDGAYGDPSEGYFRCEACQRIVIENYTWERYEQDGLCPRCAAKTYIEDEDAWIRLTDEDIAIVTLDVIRKAKHVIGVEMPVPKSIQFVGNVEFDRSTGEKLYSTREAGVEELKELLEQAKADGHKRALLILDAAYQFAVGIGVYVDARPARAKASDLPVDSPDVLFSNEGTVCTFEPISDVAKDWIREHVQSEPWQWLAGRLAVEHRCASELIEAMRDDGLTVAKG